MAAAVWRRVQGQAQWHSLGLDAWGAADLILSGTLWPISLPQQKTWVSVSDWVTVPSGSYTQHQSIEPWRQPLAERYPDRLHARVSRQMDLGCCRRLDRLRPEPECRCGQFDAQPELHSYNAYTWVSYDITDVMRRAMPCFGSGIISMGYAGTFGGVQKLAGIATATKPMNSSSVGPMSSSSRRNGRFCCR